jgi:hypothetical protein
MIPLSTSSYDSSTTDKTLHHDLANFGRTITHTDSKVIDEIPQGNILKDLRHYYNTVTTKRQLGLDVPAGFRSHSMHHRQHILHTPPRKSTHDQPGIQTPSNDNETIPEHLSTTPIHSNNLLVWTHCPQ